MIAMRLCLAALFAAFSFAASAQAPAQQEFDPPGGKPAQAILFVSGQGGPKNYVPIARQFAAQGYYVSLIDGNDVFKPNNAGEAPFKAALERTRTSPKAVPGKIAVIGSSLGGGAALTYAARMPDQVAAVVAYYPYTAFIQNDATFAGQIKVPTLILAGAKDSWKNCCMIDKARALAAASPQSGGQPLISLVEYALADHAFNQQGPFFRQIDATDAQGRAVAFLRKYMGYPPVKN
jgi:dienelactone hydrolase